MRSNYLRVFDSGYFLTARKPNGSIHSQGETFLHDLVNRLNNPMGGGFIADNSLTQLVLQFAAHILIDGAISSEIVFNADHKIVEICNIDPATITFKIVVDRLVPVQGMAYGMEALTLETSLDFPTIFYIPVDPIANDPYRTNQIISVIQAVMNKFRLLQDFARALHNLGFDRIDVMINQQSILESCKARGITDPTRIIDEIKEVIAQGRQSLQSLEADDNPVHLDNLKLTPLRAKILLRESCPGNRQRPSLRYCLCPQELRYHEKETCLFY